MCGVLGDTERFDHFAAYQLAAQRLAGLPAPRFPTSNWPAIATDVRNTLFNSATSFSTPTAQALRLKTIVMNQTGGQRPIFDEVFVNEGIQKLV